MIMRGSLNIWDKEERKNFSKPRMNLEGSFPKGHGFPGVYSWHSSLCHPMFAGSP
jgi:hypothetical protein